MPPGRPAIVATPEEFEARADAYFAGCEDEPITITGLALALGFASRQSIHDYEARPEYSYVVKRARLRVEHAYELRLQSAKPTGPIFALKQMGWRDRVAMEHSGPDGGPIQTAEVTDDALLERAAQLRNRLAAVTPPATNGNGKH